MLHGLYRFCWLAVCCENWVGFCVRNSVSHIYGSFYFSVSGFYVFFMPFYLYVILKGIGLFNHHTYIYVL